MKVSTAGRPLPGILSGHTEPIFDALPGSVLANLRRSNSENALVWNLVYPLAQPTLRLSDLLAIRPLWGTAQLEAVDDELTPYFWGFDVEGQPMPNLKDALEQVDGEGPATEVDLFLVGSNHLIAVEAKRSSGFGRCSRYGQGRCPEIHPEGSAESACRYWDEPGARFSTELALGPRPGPETEAPACDRHYQLARTLLVGKVLAQLHQLDYHFWAIVPSASWRRWERAWLDFADRVRDDVQWRRMRVLAWEDLAGANEPPMD
ncbi:MAG: hypothetical protein R3191_03770 [Anaerolineales bacterium]|nr:hypothetical protein [Anaerolineales bacterium]